MSTDGPGAASADAEPETTCAVCFGPLPPSRHRHQRVICDDPECARAVRSYGARRVNQRRHRQAVEATERRCPKCRKTKPLTTEYWYVDGIDKRNGSARLGRWCKICKREYQRKTQNAKDRGEQRRARQRENYRRRMERIKADPVAYAAYLEHERVKARKVRRSNPEKYKARQRRYREKLRDDPEKAAKQRELRRIDWLLRKERRGEKLLPGLTVLDAMANRGTARTQLPGQPLALAIDAIIAREDSDDLTVCARGGFGPRRLREWRAGANTQAGTADTVMLRLDLRWSEVWLTPPEPPERGEPRAVLAWIDAVLTHLRAAAFFEPADLRDAA